MALFVQSFLLYAKLMLEPVASKFRSSLSGLLFSRHYQMILNDRGDFIFVLFKDSLPAKKQGFQIGLSDQQQNGALMGW